jgi:hypothetical protein
MSIATMIARSGQKLDLERATKTRTFTGGRSNTWAIVAMQIPCWKQPVSSDILRRYERNTIDVDTTVYVGQFLGIKTGDRIRVYSDSESSYLVVEGVRDQAGLGRLWALDCREEV